MIYDPYHEQELARLEHILANSYVGLVMYRARVQNRIDELLMQIGTDERYQVRVSDEEADLINKSLGIEKSKGEVK